jgi:Ca2+/Na+ antiporter
MLAYLLQLLLPGLGHIIAREYLFGLFVLLVMLLASVLAVAVFFVEISRWGAVLLMAVPVLFYIFTFADLKKHVSKTDNYKISKLKGYLFLGIGIGYQLFAPSSPLNVLWHNHPTLVVADESYAPPTIRKDDWLLVNRAEYILELAYLSQPLIHKVPERYEFVYFASNRERREIGLVLGFAREQIEISDSLLMVDGIPDFDIPPRGVALTGEWPLTFVDDGSMLIATLHFGRIDRLEMVSATHLIGRILTPQR